MRRTGRRLRISGAVSGACWLLASALQAQVPLTPLTGVLTFPPVTTEPPGGTYEQSAPGLAPLPAGGFFLAWQSSYRNFTGPNPAIDRLLGQRVAADGTFGPSIVLVEQTNTTDPSLGFDGAVEAVPVGNDVIVAWTSTLQVGAEAQSRLFNSAGLPLGPEYTYLEATIPGDTFSLCPTLSATADGRLAVAWLENSFDSGQSTVTSQSFFRHGLEDSFIQHLEEGAPDPLRPQCPRLVIRPNGDYVAGWPRRGGGGLVVQELRASGSPQSPRLVLTDLNTPFIVQVPSVGSTGFTVIGALAGSAGQLKSYRFGTEGTLHEVRVSPPASRRTIEALAIDRGGRLWAAERLLDATNPRRVFRLYNRRLQPQGSAMTVPGQEVRAAFGARDQLLVTWLGDALVSTGSGHRARPLHGQLFRIRHDAELCTVARSRFDCGSVALDDATPTRYTFGLGAAAGDQPLLGDADGDGRKDPCVFRFATSLFICDLGHDGGVGEYRTSFGPYGTPGNVPLFGDIDGNGIDEPCYRDPAARYHCLVNLLDLPVVEIDFGRGTWAPLLADFDGDGRDDPCEFLGGRFACNLSHTSGGAPTLRLVIPASVHPPGPLVPLAADLDGDGRDEACLWGQGRLVCGFFSPTGGFPLRLLERETGALDERPLLGDIDAF